VRAHSSTMSDGRSLTACATRMAASMPLVSEDAAGSTRTCVGVYGCSPLRAAHCSSGTVGYHRGVEAVGLEAHPRVLAHGERGGACACENVHFSTRSAGRVQSRALIMSRTVDRHVVGVVENDELAQAPVTGQ
jgi:hypothetical protein